MDFLTNEYSFPSHSGLCDIFVQSVAPMDFDDVKGIVQISHGMAEHSNRYAEFAGMLAEQGYAVFASDHLGHGASVADGNAYGYFGENGAESLVADLHEVTEIAKSKYPGAPVYLFGHSMGSFLARAYTAKYGAELNGAIFCGTSGTNAAASGGIFLANYLIKRSGEKYRSQFLDSLAFGSYNKRTEKKTKFDWLSRDEEAVQKYLDDDLCGFMFTVNGFKTLFTLLKEISAKSWYNAVPQTLPMLVISGEADPVGDYGKGVRQMYKDLKKSGHRFVTMKLYPDARHELLNEINRDEVYADISAWLAAREAPSVSE